MIRIITLQVTKWPKEYPVICDHCGKTNDRMYRLQSTTMDLCVNCLGKLYKEIDKALEEKA